MKYEELMEKASKYIADTKPKVENPEEVAELMRPIIWERKQEIFYVLLLDTKHGVLEMLEITRGLVDRNQVHAREVFRPAILHNTSRIILTHNHPSGDPTPSAQDISCTKSLVSAGKIIGIEILDHVIIGKKTQERRKDFLSLREEGLM